MQLCIFRVTFPDLSMALIKLLTEGRVNYFYMQIKNDISMSQAKLIQESSCHRDIIVSRRCFNEMLYQAIY